MYLNKSPCIQNSYKNSRLGKVPGPGPVWTHVGYSLSPWWEEKLYFIFVWRTLGIIHLEYFSFLETLYLHEVMNVH